MKHFLKELVNGKNLLVTILAALTLLYVVGVVIWVLFIRVIVNVGWMEGAMNLFLFVVNIPLVLILLSVTTMYVLSITSKFKHLILIGNVVFLYLAIGYTFLLDTFTGGFIYISFMYPILIYGFICYFIILRAPGDIKR
ncbi:hypothetical protein [Paenibacillus caui]|uniref:hypothetical protein n=1 Tax=Paenibacillus caui TaxID=2873927 RepID=UPI001CA9E594|nr:hypothetical protein [Paenibacillus caui]